MDAEPPQSGELYGRQAEMFRYRVSRLHLRIICRPTLRALHECGIHRYANGVLARNAPLGKMGLFKSGKVIFCMIEDEEKDEAVAIGDEVLEALEAETEEDDPLMAEAETETDDKEKDWM